MTRVCWLILSWCLCLSSVAEPLFRTENIFSLGPKHAHSSSVVECSDGSLLTCWFYGSGERRAADVVVQGARLEKGSESWSPVFQMADTPGFPDCIIFHNVTGFFTLELKIVQANNRIRISPLQTAWNKWYAGYGAPVFILVNLPKAQGGPRVKLFSGAVAQDLRHNDVDSVPGLYEGSLKGLDFLKLPNSVFKY